MKQIIYFHLYILYISLKLLIQNIWYSILIKKLITCGQKKMKHSFDCITINKF